MANRTRSRQQMNSRQPSKRRKPHPQTAATRRSNRANPFYGRDLDAQSLSVLDAANRLGVSPSTVKRMCGENKLPSFRTRGPRGHLRIPVEAVEKLRQGARTETTPASSAVAAKRANADELRADLEVRKLELEVRKLDSQESVAARERVELARAQRLTAKAQLKEAKLQTARFVERRREAAQAEERANWRRAWINNAREEFPEWLAVEQEQALVVSVETELGRWGAEDVPSEIAKALDRVIERLVAPWRAEHEEETRREKLIEDTIRSYVLASATAEQRTRAAAAARTELSQLPLGVSEAELRAAVDKAIAPILQGMADDRSRLRREQLIKSAGQLPWGSTETERTQATQAVRSALGDLPLHANQAEEQALLTRTLAPIKKAIEERATAQQERQRREGKKPSLITFAIFAASHYLSEKRERGLEGEDGDEVSDEEFADLELDVQAEVRRRLEEQLTGDESQSHANRIACEIVDDEVPEQDE